MQTKTDRAERDFDIIVWGATGFTGRLVVEYLASRYPQGQPVRWAVGARNRNKIEAVLDDLDIGGEKPAIIVADSHDKTSMAELAARTRVVLTTVGPYAKYGSELIEACVAAGTDYCDLCGEAQWIRRMIDRHQEAAAASGARIVNSCAFDSIPSDIGVFRLQQFAAERFDRPCNRITMLVRAMKGGASGGTLASMLNLIDEARQDRSVAAILADPYSLNPAGQRAGKDGRDQRSAAFSEQAGVWTAPFVMAAINTRIVRRSNALLDYRYGQDFRYSEATMTGRGFGGRLKAYLMSAGLKLFVMAAAIPVLRKLLVLPFIPKPGEGPSREERENGYFNLLMLGELDDGSPVRLRIKGDKDPGYGSTSKMLAESALCLALDNLAVGGGFWTPASAMGDALHQRLVANAGLRFELE